MTLRASYEQGGPSVHCFFGVFEGEIGHVVERFGERGDGDAETEDGVVVGVFGADEVCEEELADWEGL